MASEFVITWAPRALRELTLIHDFISQHSVQNANSVQEAILDSVESLYTHPFRHEADRFFRPNDGRVRSYEIMSHRITYEINEPEILILSVRSARRLPEENQWD